jgi:acyl-CoA reductase-like NAD-dependent aldehyde dehydrogenase
MKIVNPATEELITELKEDTLISVAEKCVMLQNGQRSWVNQSLAERKEIVARFQDLLEKEKKTLSQILSQEMGKPVTQSLNELAGARARIQYFLDHVEQWTKEEWITREGATWEKIAYEPLGVVANISAWNYPYLVGVNVFIPALLTGNAVLYKPSEYSSLTGLEIARLLYQSGLPESAFQVALGGREIGDHLLDLDLNGYFFTGSYRTGKYIAQKVAGKMVPCQLELGGKDPLYVADDIQDIRATAHAVLEGVIYNNGQSCCAVERVYVHENVYEAFLQAYLEAMKSLKIGDPMDPAIQVGPLSRKEQLSFLQDQIEDAVSKGAMLITSGLALPGRGYFIEPAFLVHVDHRMKLMKEESFGPIVGVQKVSDDREAVSLMQDTEYGLTAAVYSGNRERAESILRLMNTGTVYWNCCDRVSASLPWSGRNHSGLGTTLSYQGIRAFLQPKSYHLRP